MNHPRRRQAARPATLLEQVTELEPTCCRCGSAPCVAVVVHPVPAAALRAAGIDPATADWCRGVCSRCATAARAWRPRRFAVSSADGGRA